MKKSLLQSALMIMVLSIIFSSCRNYHLFSSKAHGAPTANRINPLKPKINGGDFSFNYIFSRDVNRNITRIQSLDTNRLDRDNMGTIEYRITQDKSTKNPLWSFFCFVTSVPLRVPALVGIPVGHRKAKVSIDVDVRDASGNLIKTYSAKAKHTSFITCWWGYKATDAFVKSHDMAFTKALNKVKQSIDNDASLLNSKLPPGLMNDQDMAAKKYMKKGDEYYDQKNYSMAIEDYLQAASIIKDLKPYHAKFLFRLGNSYIDTEPDGVNASKYLKMALDLDPKVDYMAPVGMYLVCKANDDYQGAIKWLDYTLENFSMNNSQKDVINGWKRSCANALPQITAGAELKKKPLNVQIKNLGPVINGKEGDYFPSITADESMLLFTSRRSGSTGGVGANGKYDEDLWYCMKGDSGNWSAPKNFGTPVNTKNNNGIASFTGDGQYVVCGRCNEPDGYGSCDVYGAALLGNTWNTPVNLGSVINSKEWDAQVSISADGKTLVWCSTRTGGYGNEDIWISRRNMDGSWSQPRNLGPVINTSGSEFSPYLHPDGKTLYFSSDNLSPRIGGSDIYKTTMKEDGTFTTPENLGYPINSEKNDLYFVLSPSGLKGYFGSNRAGGYGGDDIYEISYPQEMKSKLTTFVGFVFDDESKAPVEADITIDDLDSGKVVGQYISNSATGKFVVILTPGHNYALTVSKKGYLFYSENFNIHPDNAFKEVKKEVLLQKLKEGKKIVLNNIFFETGKSLLTETSHLEISKVYELMTQNPNLNVEISGHTDNVGNDQANVKLSQDRAAVVVDALVKRGIPAKRMIAKGYGKSQPYALNETEDQRALNRRTEFKIISSN